MLSELPIIAITGCYASTQDQFQLYRNISLSSLYSKFRAKSISRKKIFVTAHFGIQQKRDFGGLLQGVGVPLFSIDFQSVVFWFDNGCSLTIERKKLPFKPSTKQGEEINYLVYSMEIDGVKQVFDSFENAENYVEIIEKALRSHRVLSYLQRTPDNRWHDRRNGTQYTAAEVIEKYGYIIYRRTIEGISEEDVPEEVQVMLNNIDVRLISADRLTVHKKIERQYGENGLRIEQKVDVIAKNIAERIKTAIQKYAQLAQSKDRTFPFRAIKTTDPMEVDDIKQKILELEEKRKQLIETGILEEEQDINIHELVEAIAEDDRKTLSLYAIDTEEKLDALSELSESISLFRKVIENSFNNKKIVFNSDEGFRCVATYSNMHILPHKLSSGEQHKLVMFYDLIFNTTPNSLVLIDEPELSLHIKWQLDYIQELLSIIKIAGFYVILATHSPQIIHDNWDLTISLSK